jgi:hypothetical protein
MGPGNSGRQEVGFDALWNEVQRGSPREREESRLPASGRAHDRVFLERNRDYPGDSDLCFAIGNSVTRVRLTGFDLHRVRGILSVPRPDAQALSSPAELARWVEVHHGDHREWVGELRSLLPYFDGDVSPGQVRGFLDGLLQATYRTEKLADGEIGPGPDARALERVIALLEA